MNNEHAADDVRERIARLMLEELSRQATERTSFSPSVTEESGLHDVLIEGHVDLRKVAKAIMIGGR